MSKGKFVFAQLVANLDDDKFRHIVDNHNGNRYVKNFSCWNQLLVLMFGQLSGRESLRDLIVAVEAHSGKAYRLGFGKSKHAATWQKRTRIGTVASSKSMPTT